MMRYAGRHMDSIDGAWWKSKGVAMSGVGVLDKAVRILSLLSEGGPVSLAGVVEGTGLPRPTAHRLLSALEAHHLVARAGGRYSLGSRLLGWGSRAVGIGVVEAARPALAALRDETGESTQLYVREGDRRGWGLSAPREEGVASVSAPVFGPGGVLSAAVCASGPISRLGERPGEHLAEKVVAAAREIE